MAEYADTRARLQKFRLAKCAGQLFGFGQMERPCTMEGSGHYYIGPDMQLHSVQPAMNVPQDLMVSIG
jgi:hypothetical protein